MECVSWIVDSGGGDTNRCPGVRRRRKGDGGRERGGREVPVERIVEKEVIREVIFVEKTVVEQRLRSRLHFWPTTDLRIAQANNPVGLHASETTLQSESVMQLLYDPYFVFDDESNDFVGKLATEWSFVTR